MTLEGFSPKVKEFEKFVDGKKSQIENILGDGFEYYWELEGYERTGYEDPYYSVVARRELGSGKTMEFLFTIHKVMSNLRVELSIMHETEILVI